MRLRDDKGFTLTELIVVMGLLGVILAIAYAGFQVAAGGSDMSNRQAIISREIAVPLLFAEHALSQAYDIDTSFPGPKPNRLAFYTDQDGNGDWEYWAIEAVGNRLLVTSEVQNGRPRRTAVWSENNGNIASGVPLFTYYNSVGDEIAPSEVGTDVKSVMVTIAVDYHGTKLQDSRTVFLRNR
jgi:prepilin-type N-terminal cleavage/methylation domain-containing protein